MVLCLRVSVTHRSRFCRAGVDRKAFLCGAVPYAFASPGRSDADTCPGQAPSRWRRLRKARANAGSVRPRRTKSDRHRDGVEVGGEQQAVMHVQALGIAVAFRPGNDLAGAQKAYGFTHLRGINHFNDLRAPTTGNLGGSQDVAIVENKGFFLMGKVPQMRCVHTVAQNAWVADACYGAGAVPEQHQRLAKDVLPDPLLAQALHLGCGGKCGQAAAELPQRFRRAGCAPAARPLRQTGSECCCRVPPRHESRAARPAKAGSQQSSKAMALHLTANDRCMKPLPSNSPV